MQLWNGSVLLRVLFLQKKQASQVAYPRTQSKSVADQTLELRLLLFRALNKPISMCGNVPSHSEDIFSAAHSWIQHLAKGPLPPILGARMDRDLDRFASENCLSQKAHLPPPHHHQEKKKKSIFCSTYTCLSGRENDKIQFKKPKASETFHIH